MKYGVPFKVFSSSLMRGLPLVMLSSVTMGEPGGYDGYIATVNASHQKRQDGLRPNSQPLMYIAPIPQSTSVGSQNKTIPSKHVKKNVIKKKNVDLKKPSDSDSKPKS